MKRDGIGKGEAEAEERRLKLEAKLEAEAEERRLKFLDAKRRLEDEGKLNNYRMILSHVHSGYNFTLYAGDRQLFQVNPF